MYAIARPRGGAERLVAASSGNVAGPAFAPDGSSVAFSVVAGSRSRLMVGPSTGSGQPPEAASGGRNIADPDEDVFPFRPQWVSPTELLYTADGKIKRRPAAGGAARVVEFTANVSFTRPAFTPKRKNFDLCGPAAGARHRAPGRVAGRNAGGVRRARRSVDDAGRRRAAAPDARRVGRGRSRVVAGRQVARVLLRSRRLDEPLGARPAERRRSAADARHRPRRCRPRGRPTDRASRSAIPTARFRSST